MSSRKKAASRRAPRASFVVTISAGALALVGCGGSVSTGDPSIIDPPSNPPFDSGPTPDVRGDARTDVPTSCPKTEPRIGDPCTGVDYCDYTRCGPEGSSGKMLHCVGGRFEEGGGSSCNPPPPCPYMEPSVGSACTPTGFTGCSYPDRCVDRPAEISATGTYVCSGTWTYSGPAYVADCPKVAPVDGSSCACGNNFYGHCTYGSCVTGGPIEAVCDATTGLWRSGVSTCNPPAPDAGSGEGGSGP